MTISNEQLAELVIGIVRSQNAIIDSIAHHLGRDGGASFRLKSTLPTVQRYARVGANPPVQPILQDLPSRVLLQLQGNPQAGVQPVQEWLVQELERLTA